MANHIYSRVTIEPQEAMDKICEMIENMPSVPYGQETKSVVETFYTKEEIETNLSGIPYSEGNLNNPITESGVYHRWLYDNVGTKWIQVSVDDDIRIESPNYISDGFLIKLYKLVCEDFDNVSLTCKWYDETETECGVALIYDGVYTEDQHNLDSEDYEVTGEEDIDDIKEYFYDNINEDSYVKKEDVDSWDEDELRSTYEEWKNSSKWDDISSQWDSMYDSCLEAIQTEDDEFPIEKYRKIATRRYKMIQNCYPFFRLPISPNTNFPS